MSELIEYTTYRTRALLTGFLAIQLLTAALVAAIIVSPDFTLFQVVAIMVLDVFGLFSWAVFRGIFYSCWCRDVTDPLIGGYAYPPLNEWRQELEERGEFAHQQREQAIADGGEE